LAKKCLTATYISKVKANLRNHDAAGSEKRGGGGGGGGSPRRNSKVWQVKVEFFVSIMLMRLSSMLLGSCYKMWKWLKKIFSYNKYNFNITN